MSPQKSTSALETPVRTPVGPHRKPKADMYTVLLVIALIAVIVAIIFLWAEMSFYDYKSKGGPPVAMARVQGSVVGWVLAPTQSSPLSRGYRVHASTHCAV